MRLTGSFTPPGDKSISHRLALMSLVASGDVRLTHMAPGADVNSSLAAAAGLGAEVRAEGVDLIVRGAGGRIDEGAAIDCGNSGTTIRLLMGLLAGRVGEYVLDGDESLRRRPMERVATPLRLMGAEVDCLEGRCPVTVRGGALKGLDYRLPVASAQLKSAVLLAGLQAQGATRVIEPRPSRDHTERLISLFGGRIERLDQGWRVEPSELTLSGDLRVPGDPSSAAFFLCAAAVIPGSDVTAEGVLLNPTRIGFLKVLERMGAVVEIEEQSDRPEPWGRVRIRHTGGLTGCRVSGQEIPFLVDEVPILALTATQAQGTTIFSEAGELRLKETDRLSAVAGQLGRMGARLRIEGDDLVVEGPSALGAPPELDSFGDHRMAMTLRLAGLLAGAEPRIVDEDCVRISYPGFAQDLDGLLS
ncbi:MAG: 3-phosphoshikimate 1-carboxyvinyltransferase [Proteobacteria bacterium]|nr:3-phosphoshikimate 1-carboxyvinyltransferase [Pseudomonadota bacterium]